MEAQISLKNFERKAFSASLQDGLWDIFIGCIFIMFSLAPLLSAAGFGDFWSSAIFLPVWLGLGLLIRFVKKTVVQPRIGVMKYGNWRKKRLQRGGLYVMVAINLIFLVLGILTALGVTKLPVPVPIIAFSMTVLLFLSYAGYLYEVPRFYLYGTIAAIAPIVGEWLYSNANASHHGFPIAFGINAAVIITSGVILFIRFLKRYSATGELLSEDRIAE